MAQTQTDPTGVPGEAVPPGESRVYTWKITKKQGPYETEFACKAGAYYSTVNKVRIHSHKYIAGTEVSSWSMLSC